MNELSIPHTMTYAYCARAATALLPVQPIGATSTSKFARTAIRSSPASRRCWTRLDVWSASAASTPRLSQRKSKRLEWFLIRCRFHKPAPFVFSLVHSFLPSFAPSAKLPSIPAETQGARLRSEGQVGSTSHGPHPRSLRKRCQQDRRRRGGGASGFGREGAAGERPGCGRDPHSGNVEAGGKKLIQITDNGCGMVRDDALLAFERHATSKIKDAEDLLSLRRWDFAARRCRRSRRWRVCGWRRARPKRPPARWSRSTAARFSSVEEAGLPPGTSITVRDLFFNTPARKKFLKAESTELSHIASLVTHYALAHPDKHFELHSATNAMLVAPPVAGYSERIYQVFGKETLDQLIPRSGRCSHWNAWDCRSLHRGGEIRKR